MMYIKIENRHALDALMAIHVACVGGSNRDIIEEAKPMRAPIGVFRARDYPTWSRMVARWAHHAKCISELAAHFAVPTS